MPNQLMTFFQEETEQAQRHALDVLTETARTSHVPIAVSDDDATRLIATLDSHSTSDILRSNLWRAITFCDANRILRRRCEEMVSSEPASNLFWQDSALHYLLSTSNEKDRLALIERAFSSGNYLMQFTAAVESISVDRLRSLKKFVDVAEARDPHDHGTHEALTFWIVKDGDASIVPYIRQKIALSGDPAVIADLSEWIDLVSEK